MIFQAIKLPIPVEVMQFVYSCEGIKALQEFCGEAMGPVSKFRHPNAVGQVLIMTREDGAEGYLKAKHVAKEGDYIVKGPGGEFWPVDKQIFETTYRIIK